MPRPKHIDGFQAARLANEAAQREPVRALASVPDEGRELVQSGSALEQANKKAPPRLKKPSRHGDEVLATTADKAALRRVFGETLSDEFVNAMLTQLISALGPGPHDVLDEQTLNAA